MRRKRGVTVLFTRKLKPQALYTEQRIKFKDEQRKRQMFSWFHPLQDSPCPQDIGQHSSRSWLSSSAVPAMPAKPANPSVGSSM